MNAPRELEMANSKPQKSQRQKFIDKARELGCDEDEAAFERKLRHIAKHQPDKPTDKETPSSESHTPRKRR